MINVDINNNYTKSFYFKTYKNILKHKTLINIFYILNNV